MRYAPLLMLLVACDQFSGPPPGTSPTISGVPCEYSNMEPAASASMTVTQFVFGGSALFVAFDPNGEYDTYGPSACIDPNTGIARFIFESGGEPQGDLWVEASKTGNIDLQSDTDWFEISVFVDGTSPGASVPFHNSTFQSGAWVVDSLDPLETTILGSAINSGYTLEVNLAAAASL